MRLLSLPFDQLTANLVHVAFNNNSRACFSANSGYIPDRGFLALFLPASFLVKALCVVACPASVTFPFRFVPHLIL